MPEKRTRRPRALISTCNLALAAAVVTSGVKLATASPAEAYVYWSGCSPPKFNHHGRWLGAGHIWNYGWANLSCGATIPGIPCVGLESNNGTSSWACPNYSTRYFSTSSNQGATFRPFVRLCGFCDNKTFTNNHDLVGISSYT